MPVSEIKPHIQKSSSYNEFWTYSIFTKEGAILIVNYNRVNPGSLKDPVCGLNVSLVNFKGKSYRLGREYPVGNFKFTESSQKLEVHPNIWFKGKLPDEHHIFVDTKKKGVRYQVNIKFTDISPSLLNGDGIYNFDDEKMGMYIHIPYAKISGTIAINSESLEVTGIGFMDHTFQTNTGPTIIKAGHRYITETTTGFETAYLGVPKHNKLSQKILGYGIKSENGSLSLLLPESLHYDKTQKRSSIKKWGEKISIKYNTGQTTTLHNNEVLQTLPALWEFSGLTKWAVKKFFGGEPIYFRGKGVVDNGSLFYFNHFHVDY